MIVFGKLCFIILIFILFCRSVCFRTKLKQENIIKNTINFKDRAANIYHKGGRVHNK